MRRQTARGPLGLGALYGAGGRPRDAEAHLATALAMFTDMAMSCWAEQAQRARRAGQRSTR